MEQSELGFLQDIEFTPQPGVLKYMQLKNMLLDAIASGRWKPGTKLPTEIELTKATPFSLGTVQRALRSLMEDHVVVRFQGKGSFVANSQIPVDTPWHTNFLNDDANGFLPVYVTVLSRARTTERGPWTEFLEQKGRNIVRIERLFNVNNEFNVFTRFYANVEHFGCLVDRPKSSLNPINLRKLMESEMHLPITGMEQNIYMLKLPEDVAEVMDVPVGTMGMSFEVFTSAGKQRPIYYQQLFFPPTDRKLRMTHGFTDSRQPLVSDYGGGK